MSNTVQMKLMTTQPVCLASFLAEFHFMKIFKGQDAKVMSAALCVSSECWIALAFPFNQLSVTIQY